MIKKVSSVSKTLGQLLDKVGQKFLRPQEKTKSSAASSVAKAQVADSEKKVLMFGWELPPFNSGGLGVACYELASSLSAKNARITFVLPKKQNISTPFMKVDFAESEEDLRARGVKVKEIDSPLTPYLNTASYRKKRLFDHWNWFQKHKYGGELVDEVYRYGRAAAKIAKREKFDVIHAHDWLSYPAGMMAQKLSKKPFVAHVHALEFDRCMEHSVNPAICEIEYKGLHAADKVIAVSNYVKQRIIKYYKVSAKKIEVVHNGIKIDKAPKRQVSLKTLKSGGHKLALFVGRLTYQKGVDYLIKAAARALTVNKKINFMIVGSGDMERQIIREAAAMGISDRVFFPGFLRNTELERIYQSADLFIMPSVSEPFGLVALEALANKVPVIVSKQSGVAEVINHSLKVDFWNTEELANMIAAACTYPTLRKSLADYGYKEAKACTWDAAALKCLQVYNSFA